MTNSAPESRTMAVAAARAAADRQAQDIIVLDVRTPIVITDYFVIATASSARQLKTVTDEVHRALADLDVKPLRREGEREGNWMLLDYGDFVVHVFNEEGREYYGLERLWRDAPPVDWEPADAVSSG